MDVITSGGHGKGKRSCAFEGRQMRYITSDAGRAVVMADKGDRWAGKDLARLGNG
jgi:hypothetical protein